LQEVDYGKGGKPKEKVWKVSNSSNDKNRKLLCPLRSNLTGQITCCLSAVAATLFCFEYV
jgi:hypothetical protein